MYMCDSLGRKLKNVEIDHNSVACLTARTPVEGGAQVFVHLRSVYEPHPSWQSVHYAVV